MLETPYAVCAMAEIREIAEDELERWVATTRAALDEADTVEGYLDWKRQARETIWLLATEDGTDVGTAIGVGGWHSPEGVARGEVRVVVSAGPRRRAPPFSPSSPRGRVRSRLRGADGAGEGDRRRSLAWAAAAGLRRGGAQLTARARPDGDRGSGGRCVPRASRSSRGPSGRTSCAGCTRSQVEAYPDVPGEEDAEVAPFEQWLSMDMQGADDRPEATFVALVEGEVESRTRSWRCRGRDRRWRCTT